MFQFQTTSITPTLGIILGGDNDLNGTSASTVQASPSPTTTAFKVGSGLGANIACAGSYIVLNGVSGIQVASVASDLITLAVPLGSAPTAGQAVSIDTTNNLIAIGKAAASGGIPNLLMLGQPGHNWTTSGDFPTPSTNQATTLSQQQAAATALGIPYRSVWAFMNARINAGVDGATSNTYTYGNLVQNPHPSTYGDQVYAMAVMAGIAAQPGWLASLA